jgi:hypothetical protein
MSENYSTIKQKVKTTLLWNTPNNIYYGTPIDDVQLNALITNKVLKGIGSYTYSPEFGTKLPVGDNTISVVYEPGIRRSNRYENCEMTVNIIVLPLITPNIEWLTPKDMKYGIRLSRHILNALVTAPIAYGVNDQLEIDNWYDVDPNYNSKIKLKV